ncbi:hypothetical protein B566_EDAN012871 [Ephemera danica]|nr:hypothetical protein B566_EDAN012871 [Ephemera danica]
MSDMGPPRVVGVLAVEPQPQPRLLQRVTSAPDKMQGVPCCTPPRRQHGHFFCPRSKQIMTDEEMPCTDTVRRARSIFEARSPNRMWTDSGSVSSGVSSADLSSPACKSDSSDWDEDEEDLSDSEWEPPSSPPRFVPPGVMDRIRARGTSVTYFGGRVVAESLRPVSPTRTVLTEIQRSTEYQAWLNPASGLPKTDFANEMRRKEVVMEQRQSWNWPGKTSVLFDFRKHSHPMSEASSESRPRRPVTLSGAVASVHARLCAASTTTL